MNRLDHRRMALLRSAYASGLSVRYAATQCKVDKKTAWKYFRRWQTYDYGGKLVCIVQGNTKRVWIDEAKRRKTSVRELLGDVVETLAEDDLFQAVMD